MPVVVTEFGCSTYRGAADRGGHGWAIGEAHVERDEMEQVTYMRDLLSTFTKLGVDGAFWFTFAAYHLKPAQDAASYGVVTLTADGWEPKAVFHALTAAYAS